MFRLFSMAFRAFALIAALTAAGTARADAPRVEKVTVRAEPGGTYAFSATVRHADTGWEHYADKFEILGPDGNVLGTRVLYHPHVNEQPFTRSLGRVQIPLGVSEVSVRAHDKVHGDGKQVFKIKLPPRR